jgi:periplasmic protein TonB
MTSNEILKADILDILFDNRNKQYGAYALRKTYNGRLGIALGISLSAIFLVFFLMRIDNSSGSPRLINEKDMVIIHNVDPVDIKKPDPIIPKQTIPTPAVKQTAFVNPVIIEDDKAKNLMAAQTDLINSLISNQNKEGIASNDIPVIKEDVVTDKPIKEGIEKVVETVPSKEPEFPGGQQAWLNFLQKYLIAPGELEPGEKKNVAIRFQVSADGSVTNFEIVQSAGNVFDNEVIRVLKKMPKWKPAIQNGQPVARAFTQPVTFMGVEQ